MRTTVRSSSSPDESALPTSDGGGIFRGRLSVPEWLIVVLVFVSITAVVMGRALTDCPTTIMGGPGDATSGTIWRSWLYEELNIGPWPATSPYTNAPYGEELWRPHFITATTLQLLTWGLTSVVGPVCSWNLAVFTGFLGSALLTFGCLFWLTGSRLAAYFAGAAYAFSPYHQFKAQGHLAYVHSYLLIALIWAFLALLRKPGWKPALALGLTMTGLIYTDGYYILLGGASIVALVLGAAVHWAISRASLDEILPRIKFLLLAALVSLISALPILAVLMSHRSTISTEIARGIEEGQVYGARAIEYVVPARTNPVFDGIFGEWQDRNMHGSNYSELTIFVGWSVLILAAGYLLLLALRSGGMRPLKPGLTHSQVIFVVGSLILISLLMSGPPRINILGIRLPLLSSAVAEMGFWRVFSRFFLPLHSGLVVLAGLGMVELGHRLSSRFARNMFTLGVFVLLVLDLLTFPPRAEWTYEQAPSEYEWLATQDVEIVAEYPMVSPPLDDAFRYLTYQVVHEKKLLNSYQDRGAQQGIRDGIFGLGDPQTIPVLKRLGVELVLVHRELYESGELGPPPPGLSPIENFEETTVYRVTEESTAEVVLALGEGFYHNETRGWESFRWMGDSGQLRAVRLSSGVERARLGFFAESHGGARTLTVLQGGQEVWTGTVNGPTPVAFTVDVGEPVKLKVSPGARRIGSNNDSRRVSIGISELASRPAP
ncbi:MAG: hypothetical protein KY429_11385 [Actinobacteria bacterium]|nr:hypothetical protein [Actinomycetota bacterium]